jgi:hypothetical protein
MAGRTAIRALASLVYTIDDDILSSLRNQSEERSQARLASGTYVTHLAWLDWKSTACRLAEWIAQHPDAPVYREHADNPRFALDTSTRKAVARLLADRWQDKRGIRPQVRLVDTTSDTP